MRLSEETLGDLTLNQFNSLVQDRYGLDVAVSLELRHSYAKVKIRRYDHHLAVGIGFSIVSALSDAIRKADVHVQCCKACCVGELPDCYRTLQPD